MASPGDGTGALTTIHMDRPKNLNSHGIYVHATRGYLPPAAARARVGIAAAAGDSDISLTDIRRELMENGETGPPRMRGWDVQETPWEAMHKWDGLAPAAHTIPQLVRHCWDTATWLDDIGALDGIATMPRLLRLERDMTAHSIGHILAKHIYDSVHYMRRGTTPTPTGQRHVSCTFCAPYGRFPRSWATTWRTCSSGCLSS